MGYKPRERAEAILERAWQWTQSVPYAVTARWVFYRLLQEGFYLEKKGYKSLLALLSKARKGFYGSWRPWSLADDTRAPLLMERSGYYGIYLRGGGFESEEEWRQALRRELTCPLDRWATQPAYSEIWFEAAAMQGQFQYYANENVPLLAFHGDVSIPEKWRCAKRIAKWWLKYGKPIRIFYYGDYDPKGLIIPQSAWKDIELWAYGQVATGDSEVSRRFLEDLEFIPVGLNKGQARDLQVPENPERPGTYQWEALSDEQARELISLANEPLDITAFDRVVAQEGEIVNRLKGELAGG